MLFSGGMDSIINVFDLNFSNEDDALEHGTSFLNILIAIAIVSSFD